MLRVSIIGVIVLLFAATAFAQNLVSGIRERDMHPCLVDVITDVPRGARGLDQTEDTLRHDDNVPRFVFRFPDAFGDDFRNQRFQSPATSQVIGALFVFPTRNGTQWSSGDPSLITLAWLSGSDSLPAEDQVLLRDTLDHAGFSLHLFDLDSAWRGQQEQMVFVDLTEHDLELDSGQWFHLGYSAIFNSPDDSLAILSDDGNPETSWASEYYNGSFALMRDDWRGVNFFIRAIIELPTGVRILEPGAAARDFQLLSAYPNPFNAQTTIDFVMPAAGDVQLDVFDVLGRRVASPLSGFHSAGVHRASLSAGNWPSGVYLLRLQSGSHQNQLKILLEK